MSGKDFSYDKIIILSNAYQGKEQLAARFVLNALEYRVILIIVFAFLIPQPILHTLK